MFLSSKTSSLVKARSDSSQALCLDAEQRRRVIDSTRHYCDRGRDLIARPVPPVEVRFDLSGRSAGQFRWEPGSKRCLIRYNPWVFAADFDHHVVDTVAHEVAHYLAYLMKGSRLQPHGIEWRRIMLAFGVAPIAGGQYDLTGVPIRRQRRHTYRCACRIHHLSSTLHNRHRRGWRYACRTCGGSLSIPKPSSPSS